MRKRFSLFLCLLSSAEAVPRVMGHPVHVNMWRKTEPARGWVRATSSDSGRLSATSCSPGATSATRLRCFPTSPCRVLTRARSCFRRLLSYLHVSAEPVRKMKKKRETRQPDIQTATEKGSKKRNEGETIVALRNDFLESDETLANPVQRFSRLRIDSPTVRSRGNDLIGRRSKRSSFSPRDLVPRGYLLYLFFVLFPFFVSHPWPFQPGLVNY